MKNFLKKIAKRTATGSIAVEWVICAPFTLMITFFSVMILIFTINFHLISKNASNLVSDLNMGDTGYTYYSTQPGSVSLNTRNYGMNNSKIGTIGGNAVVNADITVDNNRLFYNTARYFITAHNANGGFTAPYCRLTGLECKVYDENGVERTGFTNESGVTESGDMIVVRVRYNFCGVIPVEIQSFGFIN